MNISCVIDKHVTVSDDGADRSQESSGKPSLRHAHKDDKRSPVNPSFKKVYMAATSCSNNGIILVQ